MTIDLTQLLDILDRYGWPMFILVAGSIALMRGDLVIGRSYREKVEEVEEWQKRYDDAVTTAREATLSIREVLNLIGAPGVPTQGGQR